MSAKCPSFINCMIIENAYHGNATGTECKPNGRVDQLEDRYLGMVEASRVQISARPPFYRIIMNEILSMPAGLQLID